MNEEPINPVGNFDAKVWVAAWEQTLKLNPNIPNDPGTMLGWFANAIMAGYDHPNRAALVRLNSSPMGMGKVFIGHQQSGTVVLYIERIGGKAHVSLNTDLTAEQIMEMV